MTTRPEQIAAAVAAAWFCAACAIASAQMDRVRTTSGSIVGRVIGTSPDAYTIDRDGQRVVVSTPQVLRVVYGDEPGALTQARAAVEGRDYASALEKLAAAREEGVQRPEAADDLAFLAAECAARQALAGRGDAAAAGRGLVGYVRGATASPHYYAALLLVGDLYQSIAATKQAVAAYDRAAQSPLRSIRGRAELRAGLALAASGDHDAASGRFDRASAEAAAEAEAERGLEDDEGALRRLADDALLAKAESLAATGRLDDALPRVRAFLARTEAKDERALAAGYNALAACLERGGKSTDALLARLHVDYLYPSDPDEHADALRALVRLWRAEGDPDESRDAAATLARRYGWSPPAGDGP